MIGEASNYRSQVVETSFEVSVSLHLCMEVGDTADKPVASFEMSVSKMERWEEAAMQKSASSTSKYLVYARA